MSGRLLIATRNAKKLAELQRILDEASLPVDLLSLADVPAYPEAPESGATFADNALAKARDAVRATGLPTVAEDSGLCVDALSGMPGVLSARWAGGHGDDAANLRLVLDQMRDVPDERRAAQFVCAAVLVTPAGDERVVEGRLAGRIGREPRGEGGFGYDPIFVPDGEDRTTAQMTPAEKDAISHRGRAMRALVPHLVDLLSAAPPRR